VEQIVPEVNVGEGFILVTPPAGLFEVNADEEAAPEAGDAGSGDNA